jgi:hypothetical protein
MLDYYAKSCDAENRSFLLKNDQGQYIAVCPLLVSEENHPVLGIRRCSSISGSPLPSPLRSLAGDENRVRRNLRDLELALHDVCVDHGICCARYVYRSYSYTDREAHYFSTEGLFDLLALGYMPMVFQSVTLDLRRPMGALEAELSKFHRKEIRKGEAEGQRVLVIGVDSDNSEIESNFRGYQAAHFASAGRQTRPQSSFDAMENMLKSGGATLFVNTFEGWPIAYLYCGHRHALSFGWSQVNVLPVCVGAPRHFLEWSAIKYFAAKGYVLYDVGPKHCSGQIGLEVSEKQKSIGFFKERFGGVLSPEVHYRKYFDKDLCQTELECELSSFLSSNSLLSGVE